jgi:very-short-patch-repair endonuclease
LVEHGLSEQAIKHRLRKARLYRIWRGVYAVGRPELTMHGHWMAAVLACGPGAVLSHESAAALWEIRAPTGDEIEVSVPARARRGRPGITVHRRAMLPAEITHRQGILVTTPVCTLIDIAARLERDSLEAAINEADKRGLIDPPTLRSALEGLTRRPGLTLLRETLDRRTFTLTDSQLERRLLPIARRAGLGPPETGRYVSGFKVDFFWPDLGLVVETDGLRYHRTPAQQARDRLRDHAHAAAGLTPLRFTHAQVRFEPYYVQATLAAVVRRLAADQAGRSAVGCLGS